MSNVLYEYDNLEKDLYRLCHRYQFHDDKNILFYKIILNSYDSGEYDFSNNIISIQDEFYLELKNNYNKIKMILFYLE